MAQENIKFPRAHMAIRDGYFYYFDERNNTLNRKICNGETAFSWPLEDTLGTNQVKAIEYDGNFFWTLQQGATSIDSIVKKWVVDNYICKLVETIDLFHTTEDYFSCDTFSLEYYNTTLTTTVSGRTSQVILADYYDKIESGTILTLGPNEEGLYEDVTVTGTLGSENIFGLDFYTFNEYPAGSQVYFTKSLWLVNDYNHLVNEGSLYEISIHSADTETVYSTYTNYWAGSRSDQQGNWEYTIASNVYLLPGSYSVTFEAWDADSPSEISLRFEGPELIDIFATNTGNNLWVGQNGNFNILSAGNYDIKGRQHQSSSYIWGVSYVDIQGINPIRRKGRIKNVFQDDDFEDVRASCFYNAIDTQYVLYVFGTTLRFYNIVTNNNEKSMLMDNLESGQSTTVIVYDLKVEGDTIYRLQRKANYYGTDYSWNTYNYQVSVFRPFVDSVSIDVNPKILPSNGINVAEVTMSVRDQYNDPLQLKPVLVEDSDSTGFITIGEVYTNLYGVATTYYKSGIIPASVIITGLATQYD